MDISMMFSDGSSTPLRHIASDQYYLTVDTLDSEVIAFAPILGSKDTRVIAVGKGQGELLKVSLELADDCHDKTDDPLASTTVYVEVDFDAADPEPPATVERQTKGGGRKGRGGRKRKEQKSVNDIKSVDMGEIFSNIAMRDDNRRRVSADMSPYDVHSPHQTNVFDTGHHGGHQTTPLEVGMYILLAVFCVAIAVFMASCFVYASKHSSHPPAHHPRQLHNKSQSVQNAHDWVWLGRQTLDKSSVATSGSRDMLDTGTCLQTRGGQYRGHYPHRFEAAADVNIIQNPGAGAEFGFVNKRGLKVSNYSPDVYAELPRKRWPRQTQSPTPHHSSQGSVYGNDHISSRSPFLPHKHIQHHAPPSSDSSLDRTGSRHVSPTGSHVSSRVNSATYTRRKPVVPSVDILPVGYPVFSVENGQQCSGQDDAMMGFQNPWEALQMVRNQKQQEINILNNNTNNKLHEYFDEDDDQTIPHDLKLELEDSSAAQQELRQSPASGLPPTDQGTTYVISPEHIQHRGEYIALNPDINKATPPRKGASKMFSDPFNVSDTEAPPVTSELLSPSHIFSSLENIQSQFAAADNTSQDHDNVSLTSVSGADCSSVCSVDSSELERDLPSPGSSSSGSMSRRHIKNILDNAAIVRSALDTDNNADNPATSADLNSVPLGSLDYSHLMNYFESLKESAA